MRIIITGGAGFIGSAFIRKFINKSDIQILNIDKLTYAGNLTAISEAEKQPNYTFLKADISDINLMKDTVGDFAPDILINFAAESHVDRSITNPDSFIRTNIFGTFSLLEACRDYVANSAKKDFLFYHISTDEVFGDLQPLDAPFTENNIYDPSSPYSASKAASDHLVRAWARTYEIDYIISNCSNNFGPFQFPEKLIPKTIIKVLQGEEIPIYGNGMQIRDWLYVDDHVEAIYSILTSGKKNENFNIGGSNEYTNISVVEKICSIIQNIHYPLLDKNFNANSLITFIQDRPGHDTRYAINSEKLKEHIGWSPSKPFDQRLEETVHWYVENRTWWTSLIS
jgi:dTDP-glucose 4,6-dehydratase